MLSGRQMELLRSLSRYGKVRNGLGTISRKITLRGQTFMPSTFNSLVDLGLVWADETCTGHYAGYLQPAEEYFAQPL